MTKLNCRHCGAEIENTFVDLGNQPPSNNYLDSRQILEPEIYYPLKVYVCHKCWLVQLPCHAKANELFSNDYAYFSSTSSSWCKHAESYVEKVSKKLKLDTKSFVVEIASNDGYLLQYMIKKKIRCLGIEPTQSTAKVAKEKGIDTLEEFFGYEISKKLEKADLIIGNNVLAHVPDINDFIKGIENLLKKAGTATFEFPHLLNLIKEKQFDTIYHEHYSYLSLGTVQTVVSKFGLEVYDVEEIKTHGGSLRVWISKKAAAKIKSKKVEELLEAEYNYGLQSINGYKGFQGKVERIKNDLIIYLLKMKQEKQKILGYGAAAKGNTLINFCGVKSDLIEAVADKAPSKQNKYLPGSHIPIVNPDNLQRMNFDRLLVLPWNLITEIRHEFPKYNFCTAIPELREYNYKSDGE